jgi:hypothetical protein
LELNAARELYIEISLSGNIPIGEIVTFLNLRAWITVDWP